MHVTPNPGSAVKAGRPQHGHEAKTSRFYFDGLSTPVRAKVAHQDACGMTLRQELPFLQLQGKLRDEDGREGSLENVSVMMQNGVATLVLDVRYADARKDATVPFLMESTRALRATRALRQVDRRPSTMVPARRKDATLSYATERTSDITGIDVHGPSDMEGSALDEEALERLEAQPDFDGLLRLSSAPLAPRNRVRPAANGWWARLWRNLVIRFRRA